MNLYAVLLVIILNMAIGMAWYSLLFGKRWATSLGFDAAKLKAGPFHYLGAFVVSIVTVIVTALLVQMFDITTVEGALKFGFLVWLGFIATNYFSGVIWAQKPLDVYFINIGCLLITTLVNTVILALWR